VLGIGGVRALRALQLKPTIWHINEGHAAFQILERCREAVANGLDFDTALELIAAGTIFTTHTPVLAGHDIFDLDLFQSYFHGMVEQLGTTDGRLLSLGSYPGNGESFNMTALALRGSRFNNGVSRIHGDVAAKMESYVWPQISPSENPISYVTNGVHLPTFLAREWVNLFDMRFSYWRNELLNEDYWNCIDDIPDLRFWSLRQELKTVMLRYVRSRSIEQHRRNGVNATTINRIATYLDPVQCDTLVLGFARRFATYKRATLLFSDSERLARLLNNPDRPVILIFAGKAHPNDEPGQQLIRDIHAHSMRPEFMGKVILIEGYDMALARKLVTGVDVWINTPAYPQEASGTSGEKAAINGVLNLSVLDGWWDEGYDGSNGWAIVPHGPQFDAEQRDREESSDLLNILEHKVIPLYFERDHQGYSPDWVKHSKASMKSIIPRFNAQRMVMDYLRDFYSPAKEQHKRLSAEDSAPARELAVWKHRVRDMWPGVRMSLQGEIAQEIRYDQTLPIRVSAFLNGLAQDDVVVECLLGTENDDGDFQIQNRYFLDPEDSTHGEETVFYLDLHPKLAGLQCFKLRMYPYHALLSHTFEMGCMIWL
jgi:starch phosphorylase